MDHRAKRTKKRHQKIRIWRSRRANVRSATRNARTHIIRYTHERTRTNQRVSIGATRIMPLSTTSSPPARKVFGSEPPYPHHNPSSLLRFAHGASYFVSVCKSLLVFRRGWGADQFPSRKAFCRLTFYLVCAIVKTTSSKPPIFRLHICSVFSFCFSLSFVCYGALVRRCFFFSVVSARHQSKQWRTDPRDDSRVSDFLDFSKEIPCCSNPFCRGRGCAYVGSLYS